MWELTERCGLDANKIYRKPHLVQGLAPCTSAHLSHEQDEVILNRRSASRCGGLVMK